MPPLNPEQLKRLKRIRAVARFLDDSIRVPGTTYRIGFDGVIGLIPVLGDIVTAGLGLFIIKEASALGAPRALVARMIFNLGLDTVGGAVPLAGDALDFLWKANRMNIRLLEKYLSGQGRIPDDPPIDV